MNGKEYIDDVSVTFDTVIKLGNIRYIEGKETSEKSINPTFLVGTINAVDGSIIDKTIGY